MARRLEFPGAEFVLVGAEVDAFAGEGDAFEFEAEALLEGGIQAQFNFTSGAYNTLPR